MLNEIIMAKKNAKAKLSWFVNGEMYNTKKSKQKKKAKTRKK